MICLLQLQGSSGQPGLIGTMGSAGKPVGKPPNSSAIFVQEQIIWQQMSLFRVSVENKEKSDPLGLLDSLWVPNAVWLMANGQAGCVCIYSPRNISQMIIVSLCLGRPRRAGATWTDGKTRSQSKCIICMMIWLWYQSMHLPYFAFIMQIIVSKSPCLWRDECPNVAFMAQHNMFKYEPYFRCFS